MVNPALTYMVGRLSERLSLTACDYTGVEIGEFVDAFSRNTCSAPYFIGAELDIELLLVNFLFGNEDSRVVVKQTVQQLRGMGSDDIDAFILEVCEIVSYQLRQNTP